MDKQKKQERLAELERIERLLNSAMDKDDFGSGLSMRRVPQINYVATKAIVELLKKFLD